MTKFEELLDIISRKKNKGNNSADVDNKGELEVAGSETSKTPIIACGDDETDPGLLDQLHMKAKTKPNDGSGGSSWDSDWD